ncbi:hypothetical protein [Neobacillus jeddahensis]|uniref:hypothetical protein n=1 Tax=Neobacillus jeddahensis TaxID=1461580 RepID=UPI000591671D|nr:hypothetical protein [Neobacillus jeddahensis]
MKGDSYGKQLVNDNLQWIIELITPAIVAINKEPDKSVIHFPIIDSENTLKQYINQFIPEPFVIDELIKFSSENEKETDKQRATQSLLKTRAFSERT